jgi:hypothetical protein
MFKKKKSDDTSKTRMDGQINNQGGDRRRMYP